MFLELISDSEEIAPSLDREPVMGTMLRFDAIDGSDDRTRIHRISDKYNQYPYNQHNHSPQPARIFEFQPILQHRFSKHAWLAPKLFVLELEPVMGSNVGEEVQGKSFIDEAVENGVKNSVWTAVDRHSTRFIDNPTNIPHFIHKHHIKKHLMAQIKERGID
ncbi:hypothetical protein PDE_03307 [Penicillium oxalicum 114-2]|uniref:Uncharacterized protein n=1 Tax=Penicillium oxalicum (strain 114-2 / CGMCC 5302) TaxID=933388 RepID=S7ZI59_PENO1|nr:hypothetical protein PDE_03307 [Penicillium oxalicum 114-2]